MSVPGIVEGELDGEDVAAWVSLSGGDEAFVTPTRTLVYRAEGLLSDESVEAYPHEADRLLVSEGRRKTKVELEYPDGTRSFAVPGDRLHDLLEPLIAGVLRTRGVTEEGERIAGAFRFSELTLVVTNERLLKHIGGAVWDATHESYHFEDVTGLAYEEGSVATQIVATVDGRKQRIKTPNDRFEEVKECLESALFAYHNVSSADEIAPEEAGDDDSEGTAVEDDDVASFGEGIDPLTTGDGPAEEAATEERADPEATGGTEAEATESAAADAEAAESETADAGAGAGSEDGSAPEASSDPDPTAAGSDAEGETAAAADPDAGATPGETATGESSDGGGDEAAGDGSADDGGDGVPFTEAFEPVADPQEELREEVEALRSAVERQNELLARQQETIESLVERLEDGDGD